MDRKHEAERLLRGGLDPSAIAKELGIPLTGVMQYLYTLVGEGALRYSDIYFAIAKDKRQVLQRVAEFYKVGTKAFFESPKGLLSYEEVDVFRSLRERRIFAGDMYEYVSEVEIALHNVVRNTLSNAFGEDETGWWRRGVSPEIRQKCVSRRELDEEPSNSAFSYTDLFDLSKIIIKNWRLFQTVLPIAYAKDSKKKLEQDLGRLNRLRNTVMHPVKGRKWSEDDFLFVRGLQETFKAIPCSDWISGED
jgi:hypothetical protein